MKNVFFRAGKCVGFRKKSTAVILMFVFVLTLAIPAQSQKSLDFGNVTGANIDESNISKTIYVDASAANASDSNNGSAGAPYKTITRAVNEAVGLNHQGNGSKIIIKSGEYREVIKINGKGTSNKAPIIIEGQGNVVIKGSIDYSSGWRLENGVYVHDWGFKWGLAKDPYTEYGINIKEIARRREMIFVDGKFLIPVLDKGALTDGTYFADEAGAKIYMKLPGGKKMGECKIELPVNERVLEIHNISNVFIKNIVFTQMNPHLVGAGASVYIANNIQIENCRIENSNYMGLGVHVAKDITIKNVKMNYNGGGGICGSTLDNVLITDSETSHNNWRGHLAGYYDWDSGGIKLLFAYDVKVINHIANDNKTSGIWFDSECRRITIENCVTNNNTSTDDGITSGIYLEGGIGPYLVKNCVMDGNFRGMNLASSNDVVIQNSFILNNKQCQIVLFNNNGFGRTFKSKENGRNITSYSIDTVIENTVISAPANTTQPIFFYDHNDPGAYLTWSKSLTIKNVYFYHPDKSRSFLKEDVKALGSFDEWKAMSGLNGGDIWLNKPYSGTLPTIPAATNAPTSGSATQPVNNNKTGSASSDTTASDASASGEPDLSETDPDSVGTSTNNLISQSSDTNGSESKKMKKSNGTAGLFIVIGAVTAGLLGVGAACFYKYFVKNKRV